MKLELMQPPKERVRCTYCHLVISRQELVHGYCPECREVRGVSHYEFEEVKEKEEAKVRYRTTLFRWAASNLVLRFLVAGRGMQTNHYP